MADSLVYMKQFITEVEAFEPSLYKPSDDVGDDEQILGSCPEDIRKLYAMARFCHREAKQMKLEMEFATSDMDEASARAIAGRYSEMKDRHALCMRMFWASLQDHFHFWDDDRSIGIREGWAVVAHKQVSLGRLLGLAMGDSLELD